MKKLHGTHSIQPLTITDTVVAEDAQIAESKIALTHTTVDLQADIDNLESTLNAHMEDDDDPHGEVLQQTTIRTENITSNISETDRTITVSNPGGGNLLLDVQGDINCNNLGVSGDTSIDGMTSIGGQTHITGNVLIDGDLTVSGRSTTVTSNTIDYDSLLVTPSTVTNRTGIIVAPDGTGWEEGDSQSQTTTETITVHDDIVDAADGMFRAPIRELSNGDLIITLPNRIVRTNPEATEIKATYFISDEDADPVIENGVTWATAVNANEEIYAIINSNLGFRVRVLNSNLELIREAGPLFEGQDPSLQDVMSFEYNNGKFYALYSFSDNSYGIYTYDETFTAKGSDEEFPNDLEYGSGFNSVSGLHSTLAFSTELSDISPVSIYPFTHNGMDYIFIIATGNMFVVDAQNLHLQGYEMFDTTDENYDPSNFIDTAFNSVLDPYNKMVYTVFACFVYGFPVTKFIDAQTYVSPSGQDIEDTISTIPVVFDTAFASEQDMTDADTNQMGWIQGILTDGSLLYYSIISHNMYWLNPEEFNDISMEEAAEQELEVEFSPGLDADFVTYVRRFIVTDEDEAAAAASSSEETAPVPLSSVSLDTYGVRLMTRDAGGNIYFIGGGGEGATDIVKIDGTTLQVTYATATNENSDRTFGDREFNIAMSGDASTLYVASGLSYTINPFSQSSQVYKFDMDTATCASGEMLDTNVTSMWYGSMAYDSLNDRLIFTAGESTEDIPGNIVIIDPQDNHIIKTIELSGSGYLFPSTICVSPDGNHLYMLSTDCGYVWRVPLNGETSYDLDSSPDCLQVELYTEEVANDIGFMSGMSMTESSRLFVSTIRGRIFEVDPENLSIIAYNDSIHSDDSEATGGFAINCLAANDNYVIAGCAKNMNEAFKLIAFDISNDTDISEASETVSVPASSAEDPEEPTEPEEDFFGRDLIRTTTHEVEVVEEVGDTFTGNLLELQKRTNGLNEAVVIVDKNGTLKLFTGDIKLGESTLSDTGEYLDINNDIRALSITTTDKGFRYEASTDTGSSNKIIDVQNSSGVSKFSVDKAGNASANTLQIGSSLPVVWNNSSNSITFSNDVTVSERDLILDDSELVVASENKTNWRILNRNSTVSFYYGDNSLTPQVEIGDNLFDTSSSNMTKVNNLLVCGDANFRGNVTMASGMLMDGIHLGSHDHSGGDMGVVLPQTSISGLKNFVDNINTTIKNCVDTMTTNNTESGIDVAYNSTTGKLNFTVNDFTLTLTGEAEGSATIAHASNTSLAVTVKNSAKLGGLSLPSGTVNTEANKVLRTDANANTTVKTLSISTPVNAGTANIAKIYASTGSETAVKYYTPANFATQILALGGTVKNSHVHTAVNGLTPLRGSGSFAGTSGKRINLPASRADTSYTVSITPTANPGGQLGEVWVVKSTAYFTVYNSGTFTGAFDYIVLG